MRLLKTLPWIVLAAAAAGPAFAQEAAGGAGEAVEVPAEVMAQMDKGDVAWMIMATILVLLMIVPGLALFYGGLVRAKNMLSVLMQCFVITCVMMILWCVYGYSLALNAGGAFDAYIGGFSRLFLGGITVEVDGGDIHRRRGDPRVHLRLLPDDLRLHHPGADRRRLRRADEVLGGDPVLRPVEHLRLHADRPYGLVRRGAAVHHGGARLRRRHGRAHQRRGRRAGRLP